MKEFKGTPGPWIIDPIPEDKGTIWIASKERAYAIASCYCHPMDEETKANGKAIAAVPQLIEALRPFEKLANECLFNTNLDKDQVVYAYNKATITMGDLRNVLAALSKALD